MIKSNGAILALLFAATTLTACNATRTESLSDSDVAPTGYWFLGDNGERQWRTLDPADIPPPAPAVRKNYATPVGNGSGRG
ncbi:hypothetical protein [Bartonella sp. LJL80]